MAGEGRNFNRMRLCAAAPARYALNGGADSNTTMQRSPLPAIFPAVLGVLLAAMLLGAAPTCAAPLDEVLEADRGFAATAERAGQQAALLEWLADDAVLFRPAAVPARTWLATHESASGRLEWQPTAGAVACSGDLAVSSGPWRYTNGDAEPSAGHYVTVWRRSEAGDWRVVLDHGVEHPAAAAPTEALASLYAASWPGSGDARGCAGPDRTDAVAKADESVNRVIRKRGLAAGIAAAAADDAIVYRDGRPPGRPASALPGSVDLPRGGTGRATGRIVTPHADLAVTHGVLESRTAGAAAPVQAAYVRVWRLDGSRWRLAVDATTELTGTESGDVAPAPQ